ncbi:hypothetical protein [Enterococcus casseliflavus]|nr:hypothetical protein [Enterococcus casseliflavus]
MEIKHKFQVIYFVQYATMAILMTQIVPFLTEQGYAMMRLKEAGF